MKNAVPGCISCCLSSFLPSFPVLLFFVLYYVLKGARELASVRPRPACGPLPRGVHQCPWVVTQALTNAIHWGKVTLKIGRAAWIDDGSVVEFTSGEQRWFSTSQLCSISTRGLLCSSAAVKAQYSCGSPGWRLSCATNAKLCHMLRGGFMVRIPLTTRDRGETEGFGVFFFVSFGHVLSAGLLCSIHPWKTLRLTPWHTQIFLQDSFSQKLTLLLLWWFYNLYQFWLSDLVVWSLAEPQHLLPEVARIRITRHVRR